MENHTHNYEHHHSATSPEEALALLEYMLGHNKHHADDLHSLSHNFNGEPAELLHQAVKDFECGNAKLEQALKLLKGE